MCKAEGALSVLGDLSCSRVIVLMLLFLICDHHQSCWMGSLFMIVFWIICMNSADLQFLCYEWDILFKYTLVSWLVLYHAAFYFPMVDKTLGYLEMTNIACIIMHFMHSFTGSSVQIFLSWSCFFLAVPKDDNPPVFYQRESKASDGASSSWNGWDEDSVD